MRRFAIILLFVALSAEAMAQTGCRVNYEDWDGLRASFSAGRCQMSDFVSHNRQWQTLSMDGCLPSSSVGMPQLPVYVAMLEVPVCQGFAVAVTNAEYDTITLAGAPLWPAQPSRSKSDTAWHPLVVDEALYGKDAYCGDELVRVEPVGVARDRNLARLMISPVRYNPAQGTLVVCRYADIAVTYLDADAEGSVAMFERYHTPAFNGGVTTLNSLYPKAVRTDAPIRYLIVAHSMFRGQLDGFVEWKRRKGFITDIVYTDDPGVGTTNTAISNYIRGQYTNATTASPAPTYLLLVGDHEQIPAFDAQVSSPSSDHITDLYYTTWTSGDHIPDCYYGRFSAQTVSQLTPQVEKTLMYEQYTFADPAFLDRAVMVAGVDGGNSGDYGYTHADPAMDYAVTNYVNGAHGFADVRYFKNNTSIVPSGVSNVAVASSASSMSATVRNYYNQGAALINYSAHGGSTSWGTPNFTTTHINAMTNTQKFGLMIGNCCLTNKFEVSTCFGEALLRKDGYCGAEGYIGGSNSTYWSEDFYWAVGQRSGIGPTMSMAYDATHLGVYDRTFHTHNEAFAQQTPTQGSMVMQGNMAVENSTSSLKYYYWEIYHLMGDPSLMPYLTQADTLPLAATSAILSNATSLSVVAVPYAYVALTDTATRTLVAAAWADATGQATLPLTGGLLVGGYELAASAQQYRTTIMPVAVLPPDGPYAMTAALTADSALLPGATVDMAMCVVNMGVDTATGVVVRMAMSNGIVALAADSVAVGTLAPGDTAVLHIAVGVSAAAVDGDNAMLSCLTGWDGCEQPTATSYLLTVVAPRVALSCGGATAIQPGGTATVAVTVSNIGHAALTDATLTTVSSRLLAATPHTHSVTLAPGSCTIMDFALLADSLSPLAINIPVAVSLTHPMAAAEDSLLVYVGDEPRESFEGGTTHLTGWIQGTYPWTTDTASPAAGVWCARSCRTLQHSQTSEMSITHSVATADSVTFFYSVSSEANYDKFHFYIDDDEKITASGEVSWTRAAFAVPAGTHTYRFTYSKVLLSAKNFFLACARVRTS